MKTAFFLLRASLILSCTSLCSGSIIFWNGNAVTPTSGSDPGISSAVFADPAGNQHYTTTPPTLINGSSISSGYTGVSGPASGGNNFQASSKIGALSTSSSTYFSVTLTPNAGYSMTLNSIEFGERSTATGPQLITVYSSIDNFLSPISSVTAANNLTWSLKTMTLGALTASSATTLRIYGSGGGPNQGTSPNWRIDDISLSLTTAAVPEPSTFIAGALLALPFGVQGVRYLRNRKRA